MQTILDVVITLIFTEQAQVQIVGPCVPCVHVVYLAIKFDIIKTASVISEFTVQPITLLPYRHRR